MAFVYTDPMNFLRPVVRRRSLTFWLLFLLLVWGALLWDIGLSALSFDESATYFVTDRPPLAIVRYLRQAANEHPPIYYLLIRGWMALVGTSEFSLRLFSLEIGMLLLVLTGWLARLAARQQRGTSLVGVDWVTAVLFAATPGMAFYARNARMYSLTAVWAVLAAGLLLKDWLATEERPRWNHILTLAVINGLALLTHYYLLLFIIAQPLALLAARRWRSFWIWTAVHSIPALIGLIWLSTATGLQNTLTSLFTNTTFTSPTYHQVIRLLEKMISTSRFRTQYYVLPIIMLLIVGGVLIAWRRRQRIGAWLSMLLIVPFTLAYLLPREPESRYLVFLLPFAALAIAHAVVWPSNLIKTHFVKWLVGLGLLGSIVWMLFNAGYTHVLAVTEDHYGRTLATVQKYARPGDETLFYGPWQVIPFHYYDPGGLPPQTLLPPQAPPLLDPAQAAPMLTELLDRSDRLWVVAMADKTVDPDQFVWHWLRDHAHAVWQQEGARLYLPPLPDDAPTQSLELAFGPALVLDQMAYEPGPIGAGEPIRLTFSWQSLQFLEEGAAMTLSLVDGIEFTWATAVSVLQNGRTPQTILSYEGLTAPQGMPPDEYELRLRLVDKASGALLLVNGAETALLQTVSITNPTHEPILLDLPGANGVEFCSPDRSNCLKLAGGEPIGERFQPSFPMWLQLHWHTPSKTLPKLQVRLQITPDPQFAWPGTAAAPMMTRTIPLSSDQWASERLITLPVVMDIPPDMPAGTAKVTLELLDENGRFWTTTTKTPSDLFPIIIEKRPTLTNLPAGLTPLTADFGDEIGLRGYRVEGDLCPGGQLELTYGWVARQRPSQVYAVFNHLVTADEKQAAQVDGWPQGGRLLTSQWQPGEYIEDRHIMAIPQDTLSGPYTLYIGFYEIESGDRLPAFQDGQRLPADRIPIPLPEVCE